MIVNCKQCKEEFKVSPSVVKKGKGLFCSRFCCDSWGKKNFVKSNAKNWRGGKVFKKCLECGVIFLVYPYYKNRLFCNNKCRGIWLSKNNRREKSSSWKGGLTPIFATIRNSKKTMEWRNQIFKRDNYSCQKCGDSKGGNLHAHHIKKFSVILNDLKQKFPLSLVVDIADNYSELWDINNGITLCKSCHKKEHKK